MTQLRLTRLLKHTCRLRYGYGHANKMVSYMPNHQPDYFRTCPLQKNYHISQKMEAVYYHQCLGLV